MHVIVTSRKHKRKQRANEFQTSVIACTTFRYKSKFNQVKLRLRILFLKLYSSGYISLLQNASEKNIANE